MVGVVIVAIGLWFSVIAIRRNMPRTCPHDVEPAVMQGPSDGADSLEVESRPATPATPDFTAVRVRGKGDNNQVSVALGLKKASRRLVDHN